MKFLTALLLSSLFAANPPAKLSNDSLGNIKSIHVKNGENFEIRMTIDGVKDEHETSILTLEGEYKCPTHKSWVPIDLSNTFIHSLKSAGIEKDRKVCSLENVDADLDNMEIRVYKIENGKCAKQATAIMVPIRKNDFSKLTGLCDLFNETGKKAKQ